MHLKFLSLILTVVLLFGMGGKVKESNPENIDFQKITEANNQFCLKLYKNLIEKEKGNVFFSPLSITMAMAMVFEGARKWTATEIHDVFQFPLEDDIRRFSFSALYHKLNKKDAKYKLSIANGLWIQKDYRILPEYLRIVNDYYFGSAMSVDFINETERSRKVINQWVEEKTNNKIKDLFPPGSLNSQTRLVITNAIYFKGQWVKQFDRKLTNEEDFWISESKTVKVPMMRRTDPQAVFNYGETEELQILEMPYEGDDLSMIVLLPKEKNLNNLESNLNGEKLDEWKGLLSPRRVDVYLPRFTFKTKYKLTANLSALGMPNAFSPHADFTGISPAKDLYIQMVVHQAFVDVNEEGTEAAAATGVVVGITSVGPQTPVFRADHPFVFIIQERSTGNILFIGRVVEPES